MASSGFVGAVTVRGAGEEDKQDTDALSADLLDKADYSPAHTCCDDIWILIKKLLSFIAITFDGSAKSMAWDILFFLVTDLIKGIPEQDNQQPAQLWMTLGALVALSVPSTMGFVTMQRHQIVDRADGEEDKSIESAHGQQISWNISAAVILASATDSAGIVAAWLLNPLCNNTFRMALSVPLGSLWWVKVMMMDMLAAQRKYVESHPEEALLATQPRFSFLYGHSEYIAKFLRETFGPLMGGLYAYSFLNFMLEFQGKDYSDMSWYHILPLIPIFQSGSLMISHFAIRQMNENLEMTQIHIKRDSWLLRSDKAPLNFCYDLPCTKPDSCAAIFFRYVGNSLHGEWLVELVSRLSCMREETQIKLLKLCVGFFNGLGVGAFFHNMLASFISSPNPERGFMFKKWLGSEGALHAASGFNIFALCLSVAVAFAQSNSKCAGLQKAIQELRARQGVSLDRENRLLTRSPQAYFEQPHSAAAVAAGILPPPPGFESVNSVGPS